MSSSEFLVENTANSNVHVSTAYKRPASSLDAGVYGKPLTAMECLQKVTLPPPPSSGSSKTVDNAAYDYNNKQGDAAGEPASGVSTEMAEENKKLHYEDNGAVWSQECPWVLYRADNGHLYWFNHVTRASQWAAQTTDPSIPSIPLDKLPYLLGRGAPSTSSVENPEATGYGHVESSHACVDFTRATSSAHPAAHGYMHKETEAWESEASEASSEREYDSDASSESWDSEDERDFTRLLETVEGRAALAEEEERSLGRLEARQTQRGGVLAWLLPYHDLDVSEEEDEEEEEEAEDLQHVVEEEEERGGGRRRRARRRTTTISEESPSAFVGAAGEGGLGSVRRAGKVLRSLLRATSWAVSTGLVTLYTFARVLVASPPSSLTNGSPSPSTFIRRPGTLPRNVESTERVVEVMEGGGFTSGFEKRTGRKGLPPPLDLSEL